MFTHRRITAVGLVGLVAMTLPAALPAGCSTNPVTGKRELVLISRAQEIRMGREAAPDFEKQFGGRVPNEQLQQYVTMIGRKVSAQSDRAMPYEFLLVASDVPNAFALPGGKIFVSAGLVRRMTDERQLAAVLGHETGHVAAKHNVHAMQRQMGAAVLVDVAGALAGRDQAQAAKAAAKVVASIANLRYSRDDEYMADALGITYMTRAGYNPWGMVEMLTVLYNLNRSEPGSLGEMFQTHPLTSKRIDRARAIIRGNKQYQRFSPDALNSGKARFLKMRALLIKTLATMPTAPAGP